MVEIPINQLTRWEHRNFHNIFFHRRGRKNMANVYWHVKCKFRRSHVNLWPPSCDWLAWLVSSDEEEQSVCSGVMKQSMFLLQQSCMPFLSSNIGAGFHLLRPNGRSDTREWRRLIKYLHSFEPFLLVTLRVRCVCNVLKFQAELCFTTIGALGLTSRGHAWIAWPIKCK